MNATSDRRKKDRGCPRPAGKAVAGGHAWLGEVPEGWEIERLKWSTTLVTENADSVSRPVALENLEGWTGRFLPSGSGYQNAGTAFRSGDILYGKLRPYLAKTWLADSDGEAVGDFHVLRIGENVDGSFRVYQLLDPVVVDQLNGSTSGAKMPRVGWEFLGNLQLPLPPLPEQRAIASFLDAETAKIDALVAEQRRLIALLHEKRAAVIQHAVTRGLDPDVPLKPSGIEWLGEVPEHWEVVPLKHLLSSRGGKTPSKQNLAYWDGDVPWASSKDLKGDAIDDTIDHITSLAVDEADMEMFPAGTVLVTVRGMILQHTFPVVTVNVPTTINQDLKALISTERLAPGYCEVLLRGLSPAILGIVDEAGHGTKVLRMELLMNLPTPVPRKEEQAAAIESVRSGVADLEALLAEADRSIALLLERRSALISAAVTGKIRVPVG